MALRDPKGRLVRLGVLDPSLESARAATTGVATRAADVLRLRLVLIGLGLVRDVGVGLRSRRLVGRARAGGHVAARDRNRDVGVDRVLIALRDPDRRLLGVRLLGTELEAARPAAACLAGAAAADVLAQRLVLIGLGLVRDVRVSLRARRLRRRAGA